MKRALLAAALLAAYSAEAQAETVFIGNAFVDFVSGGPTCTSTFSVGDTGRLIYRPRGVALGNDGNSYLSYSNTRSTYSIVAQNADFAASTNAAGQSISSRASNTTATSGITVWAEAPASPGAATPNVTLRVRMANFFAVSNCIVELRANLVRR